MVIGKAEQSQTAGDNSANYQAGKDIHVHGLSLDEARTVAMDVYRANALELAGVAQTIALARAEQLTNDFLGKLARELPERMPELSDPDVQNVLFEAQRGYARSGEADLKVALVDLLAARVGEDERELRTLALNEAIGSIPKLTEKQRRAIAWIFYLRYTRAVGVKTVDAFYQRLAGVVGSLGADVPTGRADYQHIEYVGAGSVSVLRSTFAKHLFNGAEGLYSRGFDEGAIDSVLVADLRASGFLQQAIRDNTKVQLPILADQDLDDELSRRGLTHRKSEIEPLLAMGRMSDEDSLAEALSRVPTLAPLQVEWDDEDAAMSFMTLTSVGLAIGHAYWSRLTGEQAPLSIWLP